MRHIQELLSHIHSTLVHKYHEGRPLLSFTMDEIEEKMSFYADMARKYPESPEDDGYTYHEWSQWFMLLKEYRTQMDKEDLHEALALLNEMYQAEAYWNDPEAYMASKSLSEQHPDDLPF